MHKDIWTKQGEQLNVLMEPDNRKEMFAACVKINENVYLEGLQRQSFPSCALMRTQTLGQKLLVKRVILLMERECKPLAN